MSHCGVLYASDDAKGEFQHVLFLFTRYANITKMFALKLVKSIFPTILAEIGSYKFNQMQLFSYLYLIG